MIASTLSDAFSFSANVDPVVANILLSLSIPKGGWWVAPWFGHEFGLISKVNDSSAALVRDIAGSALRWIIELGRATTIDIDTAVDGVDQHRINISGIVVKPNGETIPFSTFVRVG